MPKLSIVDFAMFALETRDRPMNVGPLTVLKPTPRAAAGFADRLVERMLQRKAGAPFHYRLNSSGIGLPSLEVDPNADCAKHVHRLTLRAPGSYKALFAKVCQLHGKPLDRTRMLWELYVIDGLRDGRVAVYAKVHHGIIDGASFMKAMLRWLAPTPAQRTVRALWEELPDSAARARRPAPATPLASRLSGLVGDAAGSLRTTGSLYKLVAEQCLKSLGMGKGLPLPFMGTPRVLNAVPTAHRVFAYCNLPLADMKAFGKAHGATVNDVLLAVLDIALAEYLKARGVKADRPVVADMPVALAGTGGGNEITILQIPLGAPGSDPMARLAAICAQTREMKEQIRGKPGETFMLFSALVHGLPALFEALKLNDAPLLANMVISNPYGITEKRYLMGAEVELSLPVSVVAPGQTLNITAVTSANGLDVAFIGIKEGVPEIESLAAQTVKAFATLKAAGTKRGKGKG
jgi:diacylglycerol O-acyltransferase / wax synthase